MQYRNAIRSSRRVASVLAASSLLPLAAVAADPAPAPGLRDLLTASGITATGHVDASYTSGFNKGQSLAYRAFDTRGDSFVLNQAYLNLAYQPADGFGAVATLLAGDDAKAVNGSYGDGSGNFALGQAYVQYASGALTVIGGRFWTLAGLEVVDSTADATISRSLLFQNAQPFAHTGIRAAYKIGDAFTAYLGVVNSGAGGKAGDDNKQKTIEAGGTYAPSTALTLGLYDYYGFEGNGPSVRTNYLDGVAIFQVSDPFSVGFNADWYRASKGSTDVFAAGAGLWLGYQLAAQWKATVRAEYLTTKNLLACPATDGKCAVEEATAVLDYQPYKSDSGMAFDVLAEVRYDFAGKKVFPDPDFPGPGMAKNQGDIAIKAIFKF